MTDLRTAAQQALEALKCLVETYEMGNTIRADIMDAEEAIASLKAALAQPEPCTYRCEAWPKCGCAALAQPDPQARFFDEVLYTGSPITEVRNKQAETLQALSPRRAWRGLSEEEIYPLYSEPNSDAEMVEFARAIEQALRSKNHE
jgi:hypothetical protein